MNVWKETGVTKKLAVPNLFWVFLSLLSRICMMLWNAFLFVNVLSLS